MNNKIKTLGTLLLAGSLASAGTLFAQPPAATASPGSWSASQTDPSSSSVSVQKKFRTIRDLARKVRKNVAPLKFKTNGTQLSWQVHSADLTRAKIAANKLAKDVNQLESRKGSLTRWQKQLVENVEKSAHEMVYQMRVAVKVLHAHQNNMAMMATTSYPQNIDMIWQKANDIYKNIGTVFTRHGVDIDVV